MYQLYPNKSKKETFYNKMLKIKKNEQISLFVQDEKKHKMALSDKKKEQSKTKYRSSQDGKW